MDQSADYLLGSLGLHSVSAPIPEFIWTKTAFLPVDSLGLSSEAAEILLANRIGSVGTLLLYPLAEITALCGEEVTEEVDRYLREYNIRPSNADVLTSLKESGYWVELVDEDESGRPWNLRIVKWLLPYVGVEEVCALHKLGPGFFRHAGILTVGDLTTYREGDLRGKWISYFLLPYRAKTIEFRTREASIARREFDDKVASWMRLSGLSFKE